MSKVRVDQISTTDDSVVIDVKDLYVAKELAFADSSHNGEPNYADLYDARLTALNSDVVRFCTWNIQNGYLIYDVTGDGGDATRFNKDVNSRLYAKEITEHLLKFGIDVCGFEEVFTEYDTPPEKKWLSPYLYGVADRTDIDSSGVRAGRAQGNMISSTRQLTSTATVVLKPRVGAEDGNNYTRTVLNVGSVAVAFYVTHLNAYDQATRLSQLETLGVAAAADTVSHVVITGDFNLHLDSEYAALTSRGFSMVNNENGPNTYNGQQGYVWHMDRIFHRGFSVQGSWAVEDIPRELGDHKPVWVDLTI